MARRSLLTGIWAGVGILILILDGKTAVSGAADGLALCMQSVIPSLFPFFVLSNLITGSLLGSQIPLLKPMGKLFQIPEGAESLLLTGFLGGYPVGAQNIAAAWRSGQLSGKDARRMLAFCNNAGPSFLFGMIAPMFSDASEAWLLWGIHIIGSFAVSLCIPASSGYVQMRPQKRITLSDALSNALKVMATVCGWVILFRVCIAFLDRWILWLLPDTWKVALIGFLELTNGCCSLAFVPDESVRFLICSGILGFGGICVTMQTISVTQGLGLQYYFPGKLMQASVSMLLAWMIFPSGTGIAWVLAGIALFSGLFLRKMEKRSGNPLPVGV